MQFIAQAQAQAQAQAAAQTSSSSIHDDKTQSNMHRSRMLASVILELLVGTELADQLISGVHDDVVHPSLIKGTLHEALAKHWAFVTAFEAYFPGKLFAEFRDSEGKSLAPEEAYFAGIDDDGSLLPCATGGIPFVFLINGPPPPRKPNTTSRRTLDEWNATRRSWDGRRELQTIFTEYTTRHAKPPAYTVIGYLNKWMQPLLTHPKAGFRVNSFDDHTTGLKKIRITFQIKPSIKKHSSPRLPSTLSKSSAPPSSSPSESAPPAEAAPPSESAPVPYAEKLDSW